MAYNKENYYKKIIKVQEIVKREKYQNGLTQKEIFHQFIADQFNISERTFYNYLAIPAQMKLKKLKRDDNQNQLQLWQ